MKTYVEGTQKKTIKEYSLAAPHWDISNAYTQSTSYEYPQHVFVEEKEKNVLLYSFLSYIRAQLFKASLA